MTNHVISQINTKGKMQFYAIDRDSGYPYWTMFLTSAKFFENFNEAYKTLEMDFSQELGFSMLSFPEYVSKREIRIFSVELKMQYSAIFEKNFDEEKIRKQKREEALHKLTKEEREILGI